MTGRTKKRLGWLLIFGMLMIPVAWMIEDWRGANAWEKVKAHAQEMGVMIEERDFENGSLEAGRALEKFPGYQNELSKPQGERVWELPDGQEILVKIDLFRPFFDDRRISLQDIFQAQLYQSEREEIELLIEARKNRFDRLATELLSRDSPPLILSLAAKPAEMESVNAWSAGYFKLVGLFAANAGDGDALLKLVRVIDRFARLNQMPGALGFLLRYYFFRDLDTLIWAGLQNRLWDERDLNEVAEILKNRTLREDFELAASWECGKLIQFFDQPDLSKKGVPFSGIESEEDDLLDYWWNFGGPQGWVDQRKAIALEFLLEMVEDLRAGNGIQVDELLSEIDRGEASPFRVTESLLCTYPEGFLKIFGAAETEWRLATIAVELEHYFLANGSYPKGLNELSLSFEPLSLLTQPRAPIEYSQGQGGRPQLVIPRSGEARGYNWSYR